MVSVTQHLLLQFFKESKNGFQDDETLSKKIISYQLYLSNSGLLKILSRTTRPTCSCLHFM